MSYILDALRRADAERERGRVPGLHSQVAPRPPAAMGRSARARAPRGRPGPWVIGAVVLLAAMGLYAWWVRDATPEPSPAPARPGAAATAPATPEPAPAPAVPEPSPPQAAAAPAVPIPAEPVRPILAPPPPEPAAPPPAARVPAPAATPPADTATMPRLADLSPEARAQIPPIQVSGSTYSDNAALRMLIVNGKVVQEGQDIAPGLRLESIAPRSAVISHGGQRYRISH